MENYLLLPIQIYTLIPHPLHPDRDRQGVAVEWTGRRAWVLTKEYRKKARNVEGVCKRGL